MQNFILVLVILSFRYALALPTESVVRLDRHCSAVVVHPQLVMTAAHCAVNIDYSVGLNDKKYLVNKVFIHEKYEQNDPHFDIAAILLFNSIDDSDLIKNIPTLTYVNELYLGQVTAVGYGDRGAGLASHSASGLQKVMPYFIEQFEALGSLAVIKPLKENWGLCRGDSGGGLFQGNQLLALNVQVKQGHKCSKNGVEAYSIFIKYFVNWIESKTSIRL